MTAHAAAYPLSWPFGRPRTPAGKRKPPAFRTVDGSRTYRGASKPVTLPDARTRLADELDRIGGSSVVLSTNLELRLDGQPRAGRTEPADPGVACYFRLRGRATVLSCDRWLTVAGNIAAISAHIEAVRGQERWGVGSVEQAFAGFEALPAPLVPNDWRTMLGNPRSLGEAEDVWRSRMKVAHPDAGGSHALAAALNAAIAEARRAFAGG